MKYLDTAVTRRDSPWMGSFGSAARVMDWSKVEAVFIAIHVAASDSSVRSHSTFCMSGWCTSSEPKALLCSLWWMAAASARRMPAADPRAQSRRVWCTISMIAATPPPRWPNNTPKAFRYSTSDDAFDRSPSLSLSRMNWSPSFLSPEGSHRGTRKHDSRSSSLPSPATRARVMKPSLMGALVNHLWPRRRKPPGAGVAVVVFARTSDPPCFSVMLIPTVAPILSSIGALDGS
mmetsp:Transcript_31964/g.92854  ORF Transcript_31964/g.92854 Transcript_31964/m.92854 type:complete len:233 (-) Transcript_31964:725-1423(-)